MATRRLRLLKLQADALAASSTNGATALVFPASRSPFAATLSSNGVYASEDYSDNEFVGASTGPSHVDDIAMDDIRNLMMQMIQWQTTNCLHLRCYLAHRDAQRRCRLRVLLLQAGP
ncbi:hypothetical protein A0H81_00003 [Grifola frondosa]|uniref:Uncharacterized protein n=1 Tax=Grifola frondosa TaxID=5627 RepID=A0A1C7MP72_GRIFR|nr:hypothetical protein A0H81_00003 [Grifola frondosa]